MNGPVTTSGERARPGVPLRVELGEIEGETVRAGRGSGDGDSQGTSTRTQADFSDWRTRKPRRRHAVNWHSA